MTEQPRGTGVGRRAQTARAQDAAELVERVRLDTETEVDEETVSDDVRKEQVEVDDDTKRR